MPETVSVDTSGSLGSALSGLAGTVAKELPGALAEDRADRQMMRDAARGVVEQIDRGTRERDALPKPPMPPPSPPPQYQETSMADKWGSLAMGMAVLGSAFTRRPAINSLNAAAGVLNAYHDSDAAAYKRNFERWKAETDYSMRMYEYQRDAYRDALSNIKENTNDAMAKVRVLASAFKDDAVQRLAAIGNVAGTLSTIEERNARLPLLQAETKIAQSRLELVNDFNEARDALRRNPNDPEARQRMLDVIERSKQLNVLEGKNVSVSDQQYQQQQELQKQLESEWQAQHPGETMSATVKADLAARAKGSVMGRTETAAGGREKAISAAVEADVEKYRLEHPEATNADIDKVRYESRLTHEGEMGRAVRQPRSASAMSLDTFIQEYKRDHDGKMPSAAEIQTFQAVGTGKSQEARSTAVRSAAIELAGEVADSLIPLVKETSAKINRTQYPDLNRIILAYEQKTGSPEVVQFGEMVNSIRYAYARALSPTGQARVDDLRRADAILDPAWSKGQINAALDQIHRGIQVEKAAIERVRQRIAAGGASTGTAAATPAPSPAAAPATAPAAPSGLPTITTQQQYDALPPGAEYQDASGKRYRKK